LICETHLTGIPTSGLDQTRAQHGVHDHGPVRGGSALGIGDDGHHHLLQDTRGGAALLAQAPARHDGLLEVEVLQPVAGQTGGSHCVHQRNGLVQSQEGYVMDQAHRIVAHVGMGEGHRPGDSQVGGAPVQLQQSHGHAPHVHAVDAVGGGQDIAIVDQSSAAEQEGAADDLRDPRIFIRPHLGAAHNAIHIGNAAGCKRIGIGIGIGIGIRCGLGGLSARKRKRGQRKIQGFPSFKNY